MASSTEEYCFKKKNSEIE
uniref:Uncharacterized protein n=1 Tax=Rhizophora mucronata TaxID=61149 RepID=A0A2P2NLG1_RHIMU